MSGRERDEREREIYCMMQQCSLSRYQRMCCYFISAVRAVYSSHGYTHMYPSVNEPQNVPLQILIFKPPDTYKTSITEEIVQPW